MEEERVIMMVEGLGFLLVGCGGCWAFSGFFLWGEGFEEVDAEDIIKP